MIALQKKLVSLIMCCLSGLVSLFSVGSSKRGETVAMDTFTPVMDELLVQGDVSEAAACLNVHPEFSLPLSFPPPILSSSCPCLHSPVIHAALQLFLCCSVSTQQQQTKAT